jgi:hypothetical protein
VEKYPQLEQVYGSENTYVFYPSDVAIGLNDFKRNIDETTKLTMMSNQENKYIDQNNEVVFNIILLDGTWAQASGIYWTNTQLHNLKQVRTLENSLPIIFFLALFVKTTLKIQIDHDFKSVYTVRTQPRESFLSTLETVAVMLSTLEENEKVLHLKLHSLFLTTCLIRPILKIYEDLVRALKALCDHQFAHGAEPHQSKEFLLFNGLYKKPLSKKMYNKLTKNSKFLADKPLEDIDFYNKKFKT